MSRDYEPASTSAEYKPARRSAEYKPSSASAEPSVSELMTRLSEQTSQLVRGELKLAQKELQRTAKHAGLGAGLFGAAGILALYALAALITTAIAALALALPVWASALIVAVVLFIAAGVAALVGKKEVQQVSPTPERAVENVKRDIQQVKDAPRDGNQ